MLFNSPVFLIGFLPICLAGFYFFGITGRQRLALAWLTGMSLVFYAWWSLACVPLLVGSIAFNFFVGRRLARTPSKRLLILGVGANESQRRTFSTSSTHSICVTSSSWVTR